MTATPEHEKLVIQGLWIGSRLSPMEELSIRSFMDSKPLPLCHSSWNRSHPCG